jgi:PAS domain-containing protein
METAVMLVSGVLAIGAFAFAFVVGSRTVRRRDTCIASQRAAELHEVLERQITERIEELRRQSQLVQSIFDTMADGVIVCDRNTQLTHWNPAAALILGVDLADCQFSELTKQFDVLPSVGAPPTSAEQRLWHSRCAARRSTTSALSSVAQLLRTRSGGRHRRDL